MKSLHSVDGVNYSPDFLESMAHNNVSESEEDKKIMKCCAQNEWKVVHNIHVELLSPSSVRYISKSCNFLSPGRICSNSHRYMLTQNLVLTMKVT